MWAAYKRGALGDVREGLTAGQFKQQALIYYRLLEESGSEAWIVMKDIPIGIAGVHFDGHLAFPHVSWFPEASSRDKIEAGVSFIWELKREHMVIITGPERHTPYWRHLGKYGLLRCVGKLRDFYGPGDHAMIFQSVKAN